MNCYTLKKLNHYSLVLSKCFYKIKWFAPGRWIGYLRQKRTLPFLEKTGEELLKKEYDYSNLEAAENPPVFVMWYQGESNMPEVIQKCFESIKRNIKNREIILITQENIKKYADLPEYIYDYVNSGSITKTFFSDIARAALLYKHGGTWVDAAVFLTDEISASYFDKSFYCPCGIKSELKKDFKYLFRKTQGWNVSFQGSKYKKFPLYDFLYHYYIHYFSKYNTHVDYFENDFTLSLFLKHNEQFRKIIEEQKVNNIREFDLALMMNKKITPGTQKKLTQLLADNSVHKITYRKKWKRNIGGQQTVFDYVVFKEYN